MANRFEPICQAAEQAFSTLDIEQCIRLYWYGENRYCFMGGAMLTKYGEDQRSNWTGAAVRRTFGITEQDYEYIVRLNDELGLSWQEIIEKLREENDDPS